MNSYCAVYVITIVVFLLFQQSFGVSSSSQKISALTNHKNPDFYYDIYQECGGSTKGCVGDSPNCIVNKNCSMLTTFIGDTEMSYLIEIYGYLEKGKSYIASALSIDNVMGHDSVMACRYNMYFFVEWDKCQITQITTLQITNL